MPSSLGGQLHSFSACTALLERLSLCAYKLAPPIFQTSMYMYYLPYTEIHLSIKLIQVHSSLYFSYTPPGAAVKGGKGAVAPVKRIMGLSLS